MGLGVQGEGEVLGATPRRGRVRGRVSTDTLSSVRVRVRIRLRGRLRVRVRVRVRVPQLRHRDVVVGVAGEG